MRVIAAKRTLAELQADSRALSLEVLETAMVDLRKMGLVIDTLAVLAVDHAS